MMASCVLHEGSEGKQAISEFFMLCSWNRDRQLQQAIFQWPVICSYSWKAWGGCYNRDAALIFSYFVHQSAAEVVAFTLRLIKDHGALLPTRQKNLAWGTCDYYANKMQDMCQEGEFGGTEVPPKVPPNLDSTWCTPGTPGSLQFGRAEGGTACVDLAQFEVRRPSVVAVWIL